MTSLQPNHRITATYGVGSGNAPAPHLMSVGHLIVAFFINPKSSKLCQPQIQPLLG